MSDLIENLQIISNEFEIIRTEVFPYLDQKIPYYAAINFLNYMTSLENVASSDQIMDKYCTYEPRIYYSFEFLKKYQKHCAGFCSMQSENIPRWGQYRITYQFNRHFHLNIGVFTSYEKGHFVKFLSGPTFMAVDTNEFFEFLEKNRSLEFNGKAQEHPAAKTLGFAKH